MIREHLRAGEFEQAVDSIVEGRVDPYTACDKLVGAGPVKAVHPVR